MSSRRARPSSDLDAPSAVASASTLPPTTPRKKYKRKSTAPLSTRQYDRMTKQLLHIQQSTRKALPNELDEAEEGLSGLNLGRQGPADSDAAVALDGQGTSPPLSRLMNGDNVRETHEIQTAESNDQWMQRLKVGGSATLGKRGKAAGGPDGIRQALAAKGWQSRPVGAAPTTANDTFAQEASFLFNPLAKRVPAPSPRKATTAAKARAVTDDAIPAMPNVGSSRGHARHGSQDSVHSKADLGPDLADMPREIQEAAIMEDLLYVLMGIEGQYITYTSRYEPDDPASQLRGPTFVVAPTLDASLRDLVLRILPLATCYCAISAFVDMDSMLHYGTVTHALCAAIRELLKEYETLLVQLEHQMATSPFFTLQKLWLHIHPTLHRFSLVYSFVSDLAAITHADLLESDSEDGDSDDESDEEEDAMREARLEMEKERKQMFQVGGEGQEAIEEVIEGGIAKGGEVLSMLWDRIERQSGDSRAHELFLDLFHQASQPYARILLTWISSGVLSDSYEEFMVFEDQKVTYDSLKTDPSDIYWEQRYTLRDQNILAAKELERQGLGEGEDRQAEEDEAANARGLFTGGARIPSFLEQWKDKVLLAGKYLNVVRECGVDVSHITPEGDDGLSPAEKAGEERIIMTDDAFFHRIERAYQRANTQLLHLLLNEYHLVDRLRSLKHYFFFSSSDFFSSFVEQAERELRKVVNPMHVRDSVKTRLQTHLGMVLGSSAVVGFADPYKDDVKVGTALDNPYESLKRIANTKGVKGGTDAAEAIAMKAKMKARERDYTAVLLDVLEFDVTVKFPVSLVISRKNMIRWKFLHTILIQLKVTERQLADVWLEQQSKHWQTSIRDHPELEGWKMRVFKLRHRMTFFVQNVLAFYTSEIIDPNWLLLEKKISQAKTVDQFLKDHTDFLNECRKECMLTDVRFVEFLGRLMACARTFYENRSRLDDHVLMAGSTWTAAKLEGATKPTELGAEMWRALEKQESKWSRGLKGFNSTVQLLATTDNPSALPLALRLQSA